MVVGGVLGVCGAAHADQPAGVEKKDERRFGGGVGMHVGEDGLGVDGYAVLPIGFGLDLALATTAATTSGALGLRWRIPTDFPLTGYAFGRLGAHTVHPFLGEGGKASFIVSGAGAELRVWKGLTLHGELGYMKTAIVSGDVHAFESGLTARGGLGWTF